MSNATQPDVTDTAIDPRTFRDVLGHYPTGVVVVTGTDAEGGPLGMVVGTFASVSLDPPLVSFMPTAQSGTYATLRQSESYCINVLAHDQQYETRTLAQRNPDKFDKVGWTRSERGMPQIDNAVARIHCTPTQEFDAGDHLIVLCSVQDVEVTRPVTPLLFFQGGYGGFSATAQEAYVDADLISAVRLAEAAHDQLAGLADRFDCEAVAIAQIDNRAQTIGASDRGPTVQTHERLGVRLPLYPPLGDVSVAWSEENVERWLGKIFPPEPDAIEQYRARLAEVREHGYSVHRIPKGREEEHHSLQVALREYALGQLTPARDRAVMGAFAAGSDFFGTDVAADDVSENVISITVPVFDPTVEEPTNSGLVLRLSSLPTSSTGAETRERIAALQEAAAEVSSFLAGPGRNDLERYRNAGLRDRD